MSLTRTVLATTVGRPRVCGFPCPPVVRPTCVFRCRPALSLDIFLFRYYLLFPSSNCRRTGVTRRWPAAAARVAPAVAAIRTPITVAVKRTGTRAGRSRPPSTWTTNRRRRRSRPPRRRPRIACPWCPYPTPSSCPCSTAVCCRYVSFQNCLYFPSSPPRFECHRFYEERDLQCTYLPNKWRK